MTDRLAAGQTRTQAPLDFAAHENVFHELSPEQWQVLSRRFEQLRSAVSQFRMSLRDLTES